MTSYARTKSEANVYHVVTRGVGRQIIFEDDFDRQTLLRLLAKAALDWRIDIIAWCFMENHIHLLLAADIESISNFMHYALSVYARLFNERHDRTGHVFQSRFHSEPIEGDTYLFAAMRYIHQNPQKAGIALLSSYRWSSYREYLDKPKIVNTSLILGMLNSLDEFISIHAQDAPDWFIDVNDSGADEAGKRALRIASRELDCAPNSVKSLSKTERNARLLHLRKCGLSIRQIERITGISRGIIAKVDKLPQGQTVTK